MKQFSNILLIIALLFAGAAIKGWLFPSKQTITNTEIEIDTVYQDTIVYEQLPAPKPDTVNKNTDTVRIPADSMELVQTYLELHKDFYAKNYYNDTLKDDTSALVIVRDTVYRNRLQNRSLIYQNRMPTEIVQTRHRLVSQNKFFIGAELGMQTAAPAVIYQHNDINYKISYNLTGPTKGPRFGIYTSFNNLKKMIW